MKRELEQAVTQAVQELFSVSVKAELTRPEEQFGDYATNVALQLAKQVGQNPREIAEAIAQKLEALETIAAASVAGPGFINITLNDKVLAGYLADVLNGTFHLTQPYEGQKIVAEYSDPNPFKVLHAGHLYTSMVGDAIANLFEAGGGEVHRVNFGGDVGLHVGKTMWAILQKLGGAYPEKLADIPEPSRASWMAEAYVAGTNAYEDNEQAKIEITELNKQVYGFHTQQDHASALAQIYWTCRQWSYNYFDAFYARIGTKFEKYYPESQTADIGLRVVQEHLGDVFVESEGAVVFKGEEYGLHTRVFINKEGIPTYEAKDVGLIMKKWEDYHFDRSVVITGNEQLQYMQVVLKAVEQFAPELAHATTHLTHGIVKLAGGTKMSSRKGNILRAVDVLKVAAEANRNLTGNEDEQVVLGAVKYAFLRSRLGGDIIYDPQESVSLQGNSGPYLQYATVRATSILRKSANQPSAEGLTIDASERSLARKLSEYPEMVEKAMTDMAPHYVCGYLYELAQTFNRFYEQNRVLGDPREQVRLSLVKAYASTLQDGLKLLNISVPEKM
jgi:arginyl-tRNA synthetase